jgi:hypothetical protein
MLGYPANALDNYEYGLGSFFKKVAKIAGPVLSFVPGLQPVGLALNAYNKVSTAKEEAKAQEQAMAASGQQYAQPSSQPVVQGVDPRQVEAERKLAEEKLALEKQKNEVALAKQRMELAPVSLLPANTSAFNSQLQPSYTALPPPPQQQAAPTWLNTIANAATSILEGANASAAAIRSAPQPSASTGSASQFEAALLGGKLRAPRVDTKSEALALINFAIESAAEVERYQKLTTLHDRCFDVSHENVYRAKKLALSGPVFESRFSRVKVGKTPPNTFGFVDFSSAPYNIVVSPDITDDRMALSLIHEFWHVMDKHFKLDLPHGQLHAMADFTLGEMIPALLALNEHLLRNRDGVSVLKR